MSVLAVLCPVLVGFALVFAPAWWSDPQPEIPAPAVTQPSAPPVSSWRPGEPVFRAPSRKPEIVGINYHGIWSDKSPEQRARILDSFVAAGTTWVRMDIAWASLQPNGPDQFDPKGVAALDERLQEIRSRGLKTLIMFYWPPEWSSGTSTKNGVPKDPEQYGEAAAWLAARWPDEVQAIELWNEPDLDAFLANTSVATYTELLKAAYPKIKAANPAMTVVAGAPTGINTDWYQEMYALGGGGHFDALGIHPYIGRTDQPPTAWDPNFPQYYMGNIANLVALMARNGDSDKQIWATEYGWSSHDNSSYGPDLPPWKRGVSEQLQADYLIEAQQVLAQWPQVKASFWYTDRNGTTGDAQEDNLGVLTYDLAPKPSWYALRCAAGSVCGPTGATTPGTAD